MIRYTRDHEWVRLEDGTAVVGITAHAQEALGDLVFVELPEDGRAVTTGDTCAVVESVKAASEVYAPLAGTIVTANQAVADDPGLVNREAETGGWLFQMKLRDTAEFDALMDAAAYAAFVAAA